MSFDDQIKQVRKIRDFLDQEAPRDHHGAICRPYCDWIRRCDTEIDRAIRWQRNIKRATHGQT